MLKRALPAILLMMLMLTPLVVSAQESEPGGETSQVCGTCEVYAPEAPLAWSRVAVNGFGSSSNTLVWSMEVYKNQLYAGTRNLNGAQVWRTSNGATWTQVQASGLGDPDNTAIPVMKGLYDYLYLGTENYPDGGEVWRTDGTTWTQINTDGFGNVNNQIIWSMGFSTPLFVGTLNSTNGAHIWKYDGTSWTPVTINGFADNHNTIVASMSPWGYHVAGTWNSTTGCQVWEYLPSWKWLTLDGFGDVNNTGARAMMYWNDDNLYVGTFNSTSGAQIWRYDNATWTRVVNNGFGDSHNIGVTSFFPYGEYLYAGTENTVTGAEVWRSKDGANWQQVNVDGFGNPANEEAVSMAGFGPYLFVGTRNFATGAEVWRVNLLGVDQSFLIRSLNMDSWYQAVAYNTIDKEYLVAWQNNKPDNSDDDLQGQRISWDGRLVGSPFWISTGTGFERFAPAPAYDPAHNRYLVAWYAYGTGPVIRARLFSATGSPVGSEFEVTNDVESLPEAIYVPNANRFLVLYIAIDVSPPAIGTSRVMVQPVTASGALDGSPLQVGMGDYKYYDSKAEMVFNPERDEILVVWNKEDSTLKTQDIIGRRLAYLGGFVTLGDPFPISDLTAPRANFGPAVGVLGTPTNSGQYLVTWTQGENLNPQDKSFARRVSGEGAVLGSPVAISSVFGVAFPASVIGLPLSQRYQLAWMNWMRYSYGSSIVGRQVNNDGSPIGSTTWLVGANARNPSLARGPGDTFLLAYSDIPIGSSYDQIRGRLFGVQRIYLPMIRR